MDNPREPAERSDSRGFLRWWGAFWVARAHALPTSDRAGSPYDRNMTPKLTEYIEAGKRLTVGERLEVAHQLLLSVPAADS